MQAATTATENGECLSSLKIREIKKLGKSGESPEMIAERFHEERWVVEMILRLMLLDEEQPETHPDTVEVINEKHGQRF